jgi:hypothetical protein
MSSPSTGSGHRPSTGSRHALEDALAALFRRRQQRIREDVTNLSPGAFRAVMDERLGNLERQLDELKGRVNGLLFLVAGTVLAQVLIRLLG